MAAMLGPAASQLIATCAEQLLQGANQVVARPGSPKTGSTDMGTKQLSSGDYQITTQQASSKTGSFATCMEQLFQGTNQVSLRTGSPTPTVFSTVAVATSVEHKMAAMNLCTKSVPGCKNSLRLSRAELSRVNLKAGLNQAIFSFKNGTEGKIYST
jgi:hypothetical protein